MRNLKRALSLVLAVVMVIGLMVVGASAVSYNDFSDRGEIVNKDAVSMLTTLGIIEGKPDGSYAPGEGVDRAQMAKMISVIMNQGADNSALYVNSPTGLTDISTNWAKGHINYCYTLGIIAGRGNGTFDPSAGVTAVEAAKMLLVAAGYDPKIEGFEGSDWAINVNAKASALGIFRNFTKDVTAPLNRDDAALLIYNALDVEMIQKYESGYAIAFSDARTILSAMYGVYKVEGVVVGNKWAELDKTDSDEAMKDGKTMLDNVVLYSSTTSNTTKNEGVEQSGKIQFNVDTPVEYLGKTVTLYIEKTTILSDSKVLGVSTKDDQNVIQATTGTEDTVKDYLKGTGLSVTKDTEFYVNYGYCASEATAEAIINDYLAGVNSAKFNLNGISVEVIDNNNDGDVDYVLYLQETLSQVTRYSTKNENLSFLAPSYDKNGRLTNATKTVSADFADVVFADEVTTDDLILYVQYGGRTYISLPEIVTGVMSRVDRDKNDELYITVDGETYKQSYILDTVSLVDADIDHFDITTAKDDIGFSDKYDFILDSTGEYVVAYRPAETIVPNYALVLDSAWTQNALDIRGQVKILMTDGTEGTYYINWNGSKNSAFDENADDLKYYLGTKDVLGGTNSTGAATGTVITYTLDDDDVLTIKSVMQQNVLEQNSAEIATTNGDQKVNVSNKDSQWVFIAENTNAWYENPNHPAHAYLDTPNTQYVLESKYTSGDGYVDLTTKTGSHDKTYAVDKNTVAFYYFDPDTYGVAIGWDNMSSVEANTGVQVYPVLKKTDSKTWQATNLAEVLLINAEPTVDTADWLLVLSANAVSAKVLELNVVFEDGTTKAIEVDRDDYDRYFNSDNDDYFMDAYTYVENSDGTYDLNMGSRTTNTSAELLKNGTLDVGNINQYPTVLDKSNIWDVTDMSTAGENAPAGKFVVGTEKNAVIITNNNGKVLQTAWIWDLDETTTPDGNVDGSIKVVFDPIARTLVISVTGEKEATFAEKRDAVKAEAAKELGVKASDITVKIESNGDWTITDTANNDVYTCRTRDNYVTLTTADKDFFAKQAENDADTTALIDGGYVSFESTEIFVNSITNGGSTVNMTISGDVKSNDVDQKIPTFGWNGNYNYTIAELFCTGGVLNGSNPGQKDLKNSTDCAIIPFYDAETDTCLYFIVGNDATTVNSYKFTWDGITYNIALDVNWV